MDTEIKAIFEEALEEMPVQTEPEEEKRDRAILDYAISSAIESSGALDPELLEMLLRSRDLTVSENGIDGLAEAMEEIRRDRPFLFEDGGDRPRFAAATCGRSLRAEDAVVAQRYKNNPWYRG